MPDHSNPFSLASAATIALALAAGCLLSDSSHAAPRLLSDAQMSAVRGADGTIGLDLSGSTGNALVDGLSAAFSSSTGATRLTSTEFAQALVPLGLAPAQMPGYFGQDVAQTRVDATPISFSFDVTSLLRTVGVTYTGASMGTLAMSSFDARGTTIWVWPHH